MILLWSERGGREKKDANRYARIYTHVRQKQGVDVAQSLKRGARVRDCEMKHEGH